MLSAKELYQKMQLFAKAGVEFENIMIDSDFEKFAKTALCGDLIVVDSYCSAFNSLSNFFNASIELAGRGVRMISLEEPDIVVDGNTVAVFDSLNKLGSLLRKNMTQQGLDRALSKGKKLGRPTGSTTAHHKIAQVDELCSKIDITVAEACRRVGCIPRTYYRYKNRIEETANDFFVTQQQQ